MPEKTVKLTRVFKYSPNGVEVAQYGPGEVTMPAEAAKIAKDAGFIVSNAGKPPAEKARKGSAA